MPLLALIVVFGTNINVESNDSYENGLSYLSIIERCDALLFIKI